jgi:hypothetical protein
MQMHLPGVYQTVVTHCYKDGDDEVSKHAQTKTKKTKELFKYVNAYLVCIEQESCTASIGGDDEVCEHVCPLQHAVTLNHLLHRVNKDCSV